MTLEELFKQEGDLAKQAKLWVQATSTFIKVLSENNIELDFGKADDTSTDVDYDAPAEEAYKRSYTPIKSSDIAEANKSMSEAIAGEKWVEGFMAAIKLMMAAASA